MKKYFGTVFDGPTTLIAIEKSLFVFENPYDALDEANKIWHIHSDGDIARLLVVAEKDFSYEDYNIKYAFFNFSSFKSCNDFIAKKEQIIWSNNFDDRNWLGDSLLMKSSKEIRK